MFSFSVFLFAFFLLLSFGLSSPLYLLGFIFLLFLLSFSPPPYDLLHTDLICLFLSLRPRISTPRSPVRLVGRSSGFVSLPFLLSFALSCIRSSLKRIHASLDCTARLIHRIHKLSFRFAGPLKMREEKSKEEEELQREGTRTFLVVFRWLTNDLFRFYCFDW